MWLQRGIDMTSAQMSQQKAGKTKPGFVNGKIRTIHVAKKYYNSPFDVYLPRPLSGRPYKAFKSGRGFLVQKYFFLVLSQLSLPPLQQNNSWKQIQKNPLSHEANRLWRCGWEGQRYGITISVILKWSWAWPLTWGWTCVLTYPWVWPSVNDVLDLFPHRLNFVLCHSTTPSHLVPAVVGDRTVETSMYIHNQRIVWRGNNTQGEVLSTCFRKIGVYEKTVPVKIWILLFDIGSLPVSVIEKENRY